MQTYRFETEVPKSGIITIPVEIRGEVLSKKVEVLIIEKEISDVSKGVKILKAEELDSLKEMVALGGDALKDTERYYE